MEIPPTSEPIWPPEIDKADLAAVKKFEELSHAFLDDPSDENAHALKEFLNDPKNFEAFKHCAKKLEGADGFLSAWEGAKNNLNSGDWKNGDIQMGMLRGNLIQIPYTLYH